MPVLPGSLALTVINDGAPIIASDHRNNYTSIQGAVNGLIGILDNGNGIDGDPLVWDATLNKWSAASRLAAGRPRAPRVVASTMAGGPPASPLDGDIWIATAVDGNGTVWQFRYNAGSASAYKWEFIGGAPALSAVLTAENMPGNTGIADLTTVGPTFTAARGGDYRVSTFMQAGGSTPGVAYYCGTSVSDGAGAFYTGSAEVDVTIAETNSYSTGSGEGVLLGWTAGHTMRMRYFNSNLNAVVLQGRRMFVTPVRVS